MHTIKTIYAAFIITLIWLLLVAQTAQETASGPSVQQLVTNKIERSGKGVILGIAAYDEDTALFATKLLDEVESNQYYAPVFFASEGVAFQHQLKKLGLAQAQLPAVIYFNQSGDEISRITKIKAISNADYHPAKPHNDSENADYFVTLSQVLSTL